MGSVSFRIISHFLHLYFFILSVCSLLFPWPSNHTYSTLISNLWCQQLLAVTSFYPSSFSFRTFISHPLLPLDSSLLPRSHIPNFKTWPPYLLLTCFTFLTNLQIPLWVYRPVFSFDLLNSTHFLHFWHPSLPPVRFPLGSSHPWAIRESGNTRLKNLFWKE